MERPSNKTKGGRSFFVFVVFLTQLPQASSERLLGYQVLGYQV